MKLIGLPLALALGGCVLAYTMVNGQSFDAAFAAKDTPGEPAVQIVAQAPTPAAPAPTTKVDETALRYFAKLGDTQRVEAEMARLKALYPDWVPPTNLLSNDYVPDAAVEHIWDLFNQGDFAGARAAIAEKQKADPSFTPSPDLLHSLDLGEASARLRNASDAGQYQTVITIAANAPELLTCANVDAMWRLAEAFIKTDAKQRGLDAYTYILTSCTDPAERLATLQKAMVLLDRVDIEPLLALEKPGADGAGEFTAIRLDLARNAIAAVLSGKMPKAQPTDVTLLQTSAKQTKAADDLRLLGWYALNQKQPSEGRDWFEMAMTADPSMLSAHGMAVALLDLKRPGEAEAVLADYRDDSEALTTLYLTAAASLLAVQPVVDLTPDVLSRIVEETMSAKSAATAQELGWYAYGFGQPQTAIAWFKLATTWDPSSEPSAYGLLVASDSIKDTATVQEIQHAWSSRSARIANFGKTTSTRSPATPPASTGPPLVQQIATEAPARQTSSDTGGNASSCSRFVPPESLSPAQALKRAWCLMDLARPTDAAANFARALQSGSETVRSDAAYGQSLAFVRLGLATDAAVAAASAPQSEARVIQLQVDINTQTALQAYQIGDYRRALVALDERARYAPEQNDLLTLRAWSYFHIKRYKESEQIFAAVAATGYAPAVEGLNTVRAVRAAQPR
ncbi:tetratricopeptide (TPR) repeat protein [Devosia sp. UYZn731]|uniref:tetratricopeptide repeat protein n=1 Tax=Devosia sp. UYZn731 TaxID=3156345 RepID=UPI00339840B6